jgi:hypothetical protein
MNPDRVHHRATHCLDRIHSQVTKDKVATCRDPTDKVQWESGARLIPHDCWLQAVEQGLVAERS